MFKKLLTDTFGLVLISYSQKYEIKLPEEGEEWMKDGPHKEE